jgi:nickel/cobalt exporter
VIRPGTGVDLTASTAPSMDQSAELTAYPETQLSSPPQTSEAQFAFQRGSGVAAVPIAPESTAERPAPRYLDGFAKLIERQTLTPAFVALSLLAAMAWGAVHALGPGHGKTVVAAYLVGSRGTARHALLLGMTVTFAHVSSVIAVGLATLYASRFISTDDLYIWLSVISGALVLAMGAALFFSRYRRFRKGTPLHEHSHAGSSHAHQPGEVVHSHQHNGHAHSHAGERLPYVVYAPGKEPKGHGHSHEVTAPGIKGLLLLGISGGILPCPTALVVMLGAIALDRVVYGLVLITAFSFGLAAVLTTIGIVLVYAGKVFEGSGRLSRLASGPLTSRTIQALPVGSAAVILVAGLYLTGSALSAAM